MLRANEHRKRCVNPKGQTETHISIFMEKTISRMKEKVTHNGSEQTGIFYVLPEDEILIR